MKCSHCLGVVGLLFVSSSSSAVGVSAMHRLGVDRFTLVTTGSDAAVVELVASSSAWGASIPAWQQAHTDLTSLTIQEKSLQSQATTEGQSDDLQAQLIALSAQIAAKQAEVKQLEAALQTAILAEIKALEPSADTELAARYLANRHRKVPHAVKVMELTETEWTDLEAALILVEADLDLTTEQQAVYTKMQTSADVALAKQRITTNSPAIKAKLTELIIAEAQAQE